MTLVPGQPAPDFTLYDHAKNKVSLSDYKGKNILLLFYPQAFTSVCTKELCGIRDDISRYNDANAQVFGISVDSVYTLAKFRELQQYNFPLLSDFNKEVSTAYGTIYDTWNMGMRGVSKRSAFLVDGDGIIRYAEVLENAGEEPDYAAIQSCLKELQ